MHLIRHWEISAAFSVTLGKRKIYIYADNSEFLDIFWTAESTKQDGRVAPKISRD